MVADREEEIASKEESEISRKRRKNRKIKNKDLFALFAPFCGHKLFNDETN